MKKILIAAPLRQDADIFREYQRGLDGLIIPDGCQVDRFYVVNDCPEVIPEIRSAEWIQADSNDEYLKTDNDHIWTLDLMAKMSTLRNMTFRKALEGGYDYLFSVDTDLVLDPETLVRLIEADKDIVSEVFWTQAPSGLWWCNAWMFDQCDSDGKWKEWAEKRGLFRVGMTGACTLISRKVLEAGVDYTPVPNIKKALRGEDRHFCIRAACAGFEMWLDTNAPATHLYTRAIYEKYIADEE